MIKKKNAVRIEILISLHVFHVTNNASTSYILEILADIPKMSNDFTGPLISVKHRIS